MKRTILTALAASAALAAFQGGAPAGAVLPSGWKIAPAGRQIPLDTLPMSTALSKDGRFLLVLNAGYNPPSVTVFRTDGMQQISQTPLKDAWLGLTFSPDGKFVYAGGASQSAVFEFAFSEGRLTPARTLSVAKDNKPSGFIGDVAVSPDGRLIYAASLFEDAIHVINPQSGMTIERIPTGRRPYRILFHPDGKSFFVSAWAGGGIWHHKAETGEKLAELRLGQHPTDIVWRSRRPDESSESQKLYTGRLFVSAAHTNYVYVAGVTEGKELRRIETINTALTPRQPLGMTPSALALSPDESRLFIVCSDANAVAVADVSEEATAVHGFIPTGWYPTAVRVLPDNRVIVLNGRGNGSLPNPKGPGPAQHALRVHRGVDDPQYVARLQTGSMSVIDPLTDAQLIQWSAQVEESTPWNEARPDDSGSPAGNPVPNRPGEPSPIRHVIYIVKESRSYDQVLGGAGKGKGEPSLAFFGEKAAPNHHKLAREFVLFDNFRATGDVSADGRAWSTAAVASDFTQKLWPGVYAGRTRFPLFDSPEPAAYPPAGYLWSGAASAGIPLRNYGWPSAGDPVLARVTNPNYRGFDLDHPDMDRARVFLEDLKQFESAGAMPRLLLLRLANDHTWGAAPGKLSPKSMMADNDAALGTIVEAVSRSRFWPSTAIFVIEENAQNGPDHVDSHRAPAFILSPWTRRTAVDSTFYTTASVLRTIELILGLRPMTHFDGGATPMFAAFGTQPDSRPYEAVPAQYPLDERNPSAPVR